MAATEWRRDCVAAATLKPQPEHMLRASSWLPASGCSHFTSDSGDLGNAIQQYPAGCAVQRSPTASRISLAVQVTEETEEMRFNTALAAMMEFVNGGALSCLFAPFVPAAAS